MPFLDELAAKLIADGVGSLGSTIFLGSKAVIPTTGAYLALAETGGKFSLRTQNDTAVERPSAQLKAGHESYRTARALLMAAYTSLGGANGLHNVTLSSISYLSITPKQQITDTGLDGAGRPTVTFNIDVVKQPS